MEMQQLVSEMHILFHLFDNFFALQTVVLYREMPFFLCILPLLHCSICVAAGGNLNGVKAS